MHCVSSLSNANLVIWHMGSQLFVQELSAAPRLLPLSCCLPGRQSPFLTITLPEWARPGDLPSEAVEETKATAPLDAQSAPTQAAEPVVEEVIEPQKKVTDVQTTPGQDRSIEGAKNGHDGVVDATHAGDLTIDSIKEYLNG
ncbi:unnamed protein product [Echinostoma caproni]|uniref:Structural protein n=1 Tax=Echinostoma caproni TaxID=27848 RepID=A0A183BGV1_9TREM|nr:unnamed protein product [Echinostoma caproni]